MWATGYKFVKKKRYKKGPLTLFEKITAEEGGDSNELQQKAENQSITLSFLSCLAYGKQGMTAVTRQADAILQALIMISNSMRLSLISPEPLWMM